MPRHIESQIQRSSVLWFRYQWPGLARLLFSVPNGGSRNKIEAGRLKSEGVVAGVADTILLKSNHQHSALCIEFKTGTTKQTDLQKSWQELAELNGNKYVVCRSLDEFMKEVKDYLHG